VEIFDHLKETDSKIDFIAEKCLELPDLNDESMLSNDWRSGGDTDSNN
jgi:hypothetical protein